MAQTLAEKIDFLMTLTGTRNSVLARALNYDASYTSRIRAGTRGLPDNQPFVEPASRFFARAVREDYQKRSLADVLACPWPDNEDDAAALIASWIVQDDSEEDATERMTASFAAAAAAITGSESAENSDASIACGLEAIVRLFFHDDGRRDGVATFLAGLCDGGPHTLLLYSDEPMEWLYEDRTFAAMWAQRMQTLVASGSRIRIVHTLGRDATDIWEAVRSWMPLYMAGAMEPYFYPRVRDGLYHRSLFVAPGHSALVSTSVQGQAGEAMSQIVTDKAAVASLEREFDALVSLCKPLMEIARPKRAEELAQVLAAFAAAPGRLLAQDEGMVLLCHKENAGVLLAKTEPPYLAYSLTEPRLTGAVEEYLESLASTSAAPAEHLLEERIAALKG